MAVESDGLYGLALREFVPARDAIAKRLRSEGRRDEAAEVAALRRPSVAAWAVNQLMRTQRQAAAELFEAGDELLRTQARVLAGQARAPDLRAASGRQRAAVDALRVLAAGLLDEHGRGPSGPTLERVAETLHAVSLDPALRDEAAAGRLLDTHQHIGLGTLGGPVEAAAKKPTAAEREAARAAAAERAARDRRRKAAQAAERAARDASAVRAAAEQRRDEARAALSESEAALEEALRDEEATAEAAQRLRAEAD